MVAESEGKGVVLSAEPLVRLEKLYGSPRLRWDRTVRQSDARQRRLEALERIPRNSAPTPARSIPVRKRGRGRPRKLSFSEQYKIAIFLNFRILSRRPMKNAIKDAEAYGASRMTCYRILKKFGDGPRRIAAMLIRSRNKQFCPFVTTDKKLYLTDFSTWGSDRY